MTLLISIDEQKGEWRDHFGLLKELVFDVVLGTGPSVLDALADGIGVYVGYGLADICLKRKNRIKLSFNGKRIAVDYLIDK